MTSPSPQSKSCDYFIPIIHEKLTSFLKSRKKANAEASGAQGNAPDSNGYSDPAIVNAMARWTSMLLVAEEEAALAKSAPPAVNSGADACALHTAPEKWRDTAYENAIESDGEDSEDEDAWMDEDDDEDAAKEADLSAEQRQARFLATNPFKRIDSRPNLDQSLLTLSLQQYHLSRSGSSQNTRSSQFTQGGLEINVPNCPPNTQPSTPATSVENDSDIASIHSNDGGVTVAVAASAATAPAMTSAASIPIPAPGIGVLPYKEARRRMLTSELTESVRRHLIWERYCTKRPLVLIAGRGNRSTTATSTSNTSTSTSTSSNNDNSSSTSNDNNNNNNASTSTITSGSSDGAVWWNMERPVW